MIRLTPEQSVEIRSLRKAGMDVTGIVIAMRRYHGLEVTGNQIIYHLHKTKTQRPRVSRGKVFAE